MNRYVNHVYVIPEDDRDRQLADGFVLHYKVNEARIQVVPPANGWPNVLRIFRDEYVRRLRDYQHAHVIMLVDFDDQVEKRKTDFEQEIPDEIRHRVFVIGPRYTPERLKGELQKGFEDIGTALAEDCDSGMNELWDHEQLQHNDSELQRMAETVKPFLFRP